VVARRLLPGPLLPVGYQFGPRSSALGVDQRHGSRRGLESGHRKAKRYWRDLTGPDGGPQRVGAVGFEPTTFRPPAECATRLRHAPGVRASLRLRKCSRCGELKTFEDFSGRRKKVGQRDSLCRPCRSANGREHYLANRPRYIEQARIQKQALQLERTTYLLTYFETHPCVDCGERDPVVLEFDHLRDKSFAIGPALSRRSWQAILDEMEKCEVVCANCHRRRTARRRGSLRAALTQEE
jgi:hypothetical protein